MSVALEKSAEAFRTISEAADLVGVPTHVLRFWESRFPQVKPVKRAGGRRYYRPADVDTLLQIRKLLHEDGMTIRGARKLLKAGLTPVVEKAPIAEPLVAPRMTLTDEAPMAVDVEPDPEPAPQGRVLSFSRRAPELLPEPEAEPEATAAPEAAPDAPDTAPSGRYRLRNDADWSKVAQLVERLEALSSRLKGQG